jgi:TPP-dependent pyruvate/acetoin dehydrogenase alpha subunit
LKDKGWVHQLYSRAHMKKFIADGSNVLDVHAQAQAAIHYSRTMGRPSLLVYKNLSRRFGHAGTDRQAAYLSQQEIDGAANRNDILGIVPLCPSR